MSATALPPSDSLSDPDSSKEADVNAAAPVKRTPLAPATFSVSARVAMQLGRESISSSNTAIIELVKNAYDADADTVWIRFAGLGTADPKMVIQDDGHGMTETELREHWLCIGTGNKQQNGRSARKNRVQTGEKGLGRLGLDRLCRRTLVQTARAYDAEPGSPKDMFPEVDRRAIELDLQWERYQAGGQRLEAVQHSINALENLDFDPLTLAPVSFPNGTRLVLEGLKDDWTQERIAELKAELSLLLSPFGHPEDFVIEIESGAGWQDIDGPVQPPLSLLTLANWKVEATIKEVPNMRIAEPPEDEQVVIKMTSALHDRGYLPPPMAWGDFVRHKTGPRADTPRRSRCGPLRLEFHVFIRDADELAKRGSGLTEINEFLAANRGIRIYRDGFRVKPFGDPAGQHDWLTLSLRRASNPAAISRENWKVAYHQVVGAVFISRVANTSLTDQTNREGLVEGGAFDDLRFFASKVIQYFEGRAHDDSVTQNPRERVTPPARPPRERAAEALTAIEAAIRKLPTPEQAEPEKVLQAVPKALQALEEMQREQEESRQLYEDEVSELRDEMVILTSLASLGIMTASFGHERVNDATEVLNDAARLRKHIDNPQGSLFTKEERIDMLDHLIAGAQRIDTFAKFALDHVRPRKRKREPVDLKQLVGRTLATFNELLCARFHAEVEARVPPDANLFVPGWEAGWESVLVNFITNASWALTTKPVHERKICIQLAVEGSNVVLSFEDSGVGLEAGTEDDIFRPGVSTKRDEHGRQIGTGMGLTIVRSFVTSNRGSVSVSRDSDLGGARFEVRVPRIAQ